MRNLHKADRQAAESRTITQRNRPARFILGIQVRQLHAQERGLQFIQPGIITLDVVVILHARAVIAQNLHIVGQRTIIGRDRPAIAQRAQILSRIKTKSRGMPQAARAPFVIARAMGLGAIFQDFQPMPSGNVHDRVHVRCLTIKMHR